MWLVTILALVGMFLVIRGYRSNSLDGILPMVFGMLIIIAAAFIRLGMML